MALDLAVRPLGAYPADLRPGAGIAIDKTGNTARTRLEYRNVQVLDGAPPQGLIVIQDPVTGEFGSLSFANFPVAVTPPGSQDNTKLAPMPGMTVKANLASTEAEPQDAPLASLVGPGTIIGDAIAEAVEAGAGTGKLAAAANLSDLASASTARINLDLGNVNNTSDASKPVSTAQASALATKADAAATTTALGQKLAKAANLSDVASPAASRTNLGLDVLLAEKRSLENNLFTGNASFENLSVSGLFSIGGSRLWTTSSLPVFSTADPQWGINRDGVTDCRAALQAMLDAVPDGGVVLWFGNHYIGTGAGLTCDNKSVTHVALSRGAGRILYGGTGTALSHTSPNVLHQVEVEKLTFVYRGANVGGTALQVVRPTGLQSNTEQGCAIKGCQFYGTRVGSGAGQTNTTTGWAIGINLVACWNSLVEDCFWRGKDNDYTGDFCVASDHTTPLTFWKNTITFGRAAYKATAGSFSEGLNAYGNQIVAFLDGFVLGDGNGAPLAQIFGNHMNTARYGVRAINRGQIMVKDNLIYNWNLQGNGTGASVGTLPFVGIQLEGGCPDSILSGNAILGYRDQISSSNDTYAFVCASADASIVSTNVIHGCKVGLNGVALFRGLFCNNILTNVTTPLLATTGAAFQYNNYNYTNRAAPAIY